MPVQRKRKHVAVQEESSKQTRSARTQTGIKSFGKIAKPQLGNGDNKKRKTQHECDETLSATVQTPGTKSAKRKRALEVDDSEDEIIVSSRPSAKDAPIVSSTPRNKRIKDVALPSPAQTPTRGAAALFDKLRIDANARAIPCSLPSKNSSYETPPDTPKQEKDQPQYSVPIELEELEGLYSSFLKTLHLYYSHHGSTSPVELVALLPSLSKHWKKRKVTLEDVQRILAVIPEKERAFTLQDFGRAAICLVRSDPSAQAWKRATSFIDEDEHNHRFETALQKAWHSWQSGVPQENQTPSKFLAHLPLLDLKRDESTTKAAPLFARGQQRLTDLKAIQAATLKPSPSNPSSSSSIQTTSSSSSKPCQPPQTRGNALLNRILAKQTLSLTLPNSPAKHELERKSALHRIEEVARVLSLLVASKERYSLSMPAITQQLQQSLRNPISKDEVERCLSLMEQEVAPGFVRVYQSGEVKGVVVVRSQSVDLSELRVRVEAALG